MGVGMATTNLFTHPAFKDGAFTSNDRGVRRAAIGKAMRSIDLGRRAAGRDLRLLGRPRGHRGRRRQGPARRARALPRGHRRARRLRRRAGLRPALRDRAQAQRAARRPVAADRRPRAALHLHARTARRWSASTPRSPTRRWPACRFHHGVGQALWAGKLFHIDLNAPAHRPLRPGLPLRRRGPQGGLPCSCACWSAPATTGPRHFDAHAYRNEDADGVWDFAAGCMRTYLALAEKARALRRAARGAGGARRGVGRRSSAEPSVAGGAARPTRSRPRARPALDALARPRLRQRAARPAGRRGAPGAAVAEPWAARRRPRSRWPARTDGDDRRRRAARGRSLRHEGDELLVGARPSCRRGRAVHGRAAGITFLHPWANRLAARRLRGAPASRVALDAGDPELSRDAERAGDPRPARRARRLAAGRTAPADGARSRASLTTARPRAFPFPHALRVAFALRAGRAGDRHHLDPRRGDVPVPSPSAGTPTSGSRHAARRVGASRCPRAAT